MRVKRYLPTLGLLGFSLLLFDLCPLYSLIIYKEAEKLYKQLQTRDIEELL